MHMKPYPIIICIILSLPAIAQNPYESIGKDVKVLTLSNGQFSEFHPNDSLRRVGSVIVNVRTKEIHQFIEQDTLYSEATLDPTIISRWYSLDPLMAKFPSISPYAFAGNSPIYLKDIAGLFQYPADKAAEYRKKYPLLTKYLETQVKQDVMKSEALINGFVAATNGNMTRDKVEQMATWGEGPLITFDKQPGFMAGPDAHGHYDPYFNEIQLSEADAARIEALLQSNATDEEKMVSFFAWYKTLMHEGGHSGNYVQKPGQDPEKVNKETEVGYELERQTWGKTGKYIPGYDDLHKDKEKAQEVISELNKTEDGKTLIPTLPTK